MPLLGKFWPSLGARASRRRGRALVASGAEPEIRTQGFLERGKNARLFYCHWPAAAGTEPGALGRTLVLVHGYGEHCLRYDGLARFLAGRGHAVWAYDARGHGQSSGQRGHVRDYAEYVDDLRAFVQHVAAHGADRSLFLLGHSNGGLTVVRALQLGLPGVAGAILTSPLLGLPPGRKPVPDALARWLSFCVARLPLPSGIRAHELTHEQSLLDAVLTDPAVHRVATPRWYWSMIGASELALREAHRLTLPLLIIQGELDAMLDLGAVARFHAGVASADKQLIIRTGEYHEVLNELDRVALFALVADWLDRVSG
jgi:alpha-beta hydrolase superfamily lysophospholipase